MQLSPVLDRIPPQALDMERAVLGCMMGDPTRAAVATARDMLATEDFYRPGNARIFDAILAVEDRGEPVEALTVQQQLEQVGWLDVAGGWEYLLNCCEAPGTYLAVETYAQKVADAAYMRRLMGAGGKVIGWARDWEESAEEIGGKCERALLEARPRQAAGGLTPVGVLAEQAHAEIEAASRRPDHLPGTTTGLKRLDALTGGLQAEELVIVAGRASMGKSAFAQHLATRAAQVGSKIAVFSVEMSPKSIAYRMLTAATGIEQANLKTGRLNDGRDDWTRLAQAVGELKALPVWFDTSPQITLAGIQSRCRRMRLETGLDMVVVDYLQLMCRQAEPDRRRHELGMLTAGLKQVGQETGARIVALSQLSRATEQGDDKRPQLRHLYESGNLENDADVVLMIYRPAYYDKAGPENGAALEDAEIIVAKHRNGQRNVTVPVKFAPRYGTFFDLEERYAE